MEKQLMIVLIILSAFVITCTDSKSRKRRQAKELPPARSTVSPHKVKPTEQCHSESCLRARLRESTKAPIITPTKKSQAKPKRTSTTPQTATRTVKYVTASASEPKPAPTPAWLLHELEARLRAKKIEQQLLEEAMKNKERTKKNPPKKHEHHQELYISKLFLAEEPEPRDQSYKRPLRDSDRDDGRLPPGERELTVKDLEDHVITSDFARKKHFIHLDETVGLRRVVMSLLFIIVVLPTVMLTLIHCCGGRGKKQAKTEEEKFMENLLSTPLLSPAPSVQLASVNKNQNNHTYGNYHGDGCHGDGNQSYQSSTGSTPAVTVWPPV